MRLSCGDAARIKEKDGKTIATIRCNEDALYYWVMQYACDVRVLSPSSFVDEIKSGLKKALEKYE